MSTLTTTTDILASAASQTPASKPFWRKMFEAMIASRERRAEREIAAFIASRGGLLNDEIERDIMRRLSPRSSGLGR